MKTATLLLPVRSRLAQQRLPSALASRLARADRIHDTSNGNGLGQVGRVLDVLPRTWPVAAATRQRDVGDAQGAAWLRADPSYVQPDINGARLLAHGPSLQLTADDVNAFLPALRPLFGDAGFPLDAPVPSRWYLRLPTSAKLPTFVGPEEALGADVFDHLPGATDSASGEGRRWRALLSEAQVVLHNHPVNAQRAAAGKPPVNSLWFWGASTLPDHVTTPYTAIFSDDEALQALAAAAKAHAAPLPQRWDAAGDRCLFDLRRSRDLSPLQARWIEPLLGELRSGKIDMAVIDFADGARFTLRASQRWRFWRRPLRSIAA